jgi:hypothetical protein
MVSPQALILGSRLDEHHSPETNGRMAVCRRCGAQTESPEGGHHVLSERLTARSEAWLDTQQRIPHMEVARESLKS